MKTLDLKEIAKGLFIASFIIGYVGYVLYLSIINY